MGIMRRRRLSMLALALTASVFVLMNAGNAWAGKPKPPHIVVGPDHETAAVFSYANAIRERVFIPVPGVDQDADGVFDRRLSVVVGHAYTDVCVVASISTRTPRCPPPVERGTVWTQLAVPVT